MNIFSNFNLNNNNFFFVCIICISNDNRVVCYADSFYFKKSNIDIDNIMDPQFPPPPVLFLFVLHQKSSGIADS